MTVRTRFHRIAVSSVLVLVLLLAPAAPAAADEVGSGWAHGVSEWVKGWFTSWQSPARANGDRDLREGIGSSHEALKPTFDVEEEDKGGTFDLPEVVPSSQEEQTCEGLPETDPFGQC